jgi:hypothetical protein
MGKSWIEMTPAERMADRIAKNRAIEQRVSDRPVPEKKTTSRQKPASAGANRNALDKFQEIKRTQGLDAAAEFVRKRTESIPPR